MNMNNKQKFILLVSIIVLLSLVTVCLVFYKEVIELINMLLNKTDQLKIFISRLGFKGIAAIFVCIVLLFFFPVVTSVPLQIALGLTYGILVATLIIWVALTIAHQAIYLFSRNMKTFYSKKRLKQQQELEEMIKSSSRGINTILLFSYVVPFVPFLIISMVAISSGMSYRRYTLFTTIGPIPEIIVTLIIGQKLVASSPLASMIFVIMLLIIVILCFVFKGKIIEWIFKGRSKKGDVSDDKSETK